MTNICELTLLILEWEPKQCDLSNVMDEELL